jgi:hypothetical protein
MTKDEQIKGMANPNRGSVGVQEAQPANEPVTIDLATMELAESVGLIGPASRTHDLHNAIQRFHDLICANATIKAAVAFSRTLEAKDEPVAIVAEIHMSRYTIEWTNGDLPEGTKLYTTPPQREQDGECKHCTDGCPACDARKLPEQEPFEYWNAVEGWVKIDEVREHFDSVGCGTIYKTAGEGREPLYTTPPQRTWVGLTRDEILEARWHNKSSYKFARVLEAKLKEKNT